MHVHVVQVGHKTIFDHTLFQPMGQRDRNRDRDKGRDGRTWTGTGIEGSNFYLIQLPLKSTKFGTIEVDHVDQHWLKKV